MAETHPFPFFGAGDASYFEWAAVSVRFVRPPTPKERTRIRKGVPAPLRDAVQWGDEGRQLLVASGQFAHATIAETYEADPGDEDDDPSEDEDDEGRFFFAATSQVRRFNEHTEQWLGEVHAICPIRLAFRAEDSESGGTRLSPWHRWSVRQLDPLLPELDDLLARDPEGNGGSMVLGVFRMSPEEVGDERLDRLSPERPILRALAAGDGAALRAVTATRAQLDALSKRLVVTEPAHRRAVADIAPELIAEKRCPTELVSRLLQALAWDDDRPLPEPKTTAEANLWATVGLILARQERFAGSRRVFLRVVDRKDLDRSAYCNALFSLQNADGSPVDAEDLEHLLRRCLPYGKKNPAIFLNAASAVIARGERERCLDYLERAAKHGLDLGPYRKLPVFRPVAAEPRFVALFGR